MPSPFEFSLPNGATVLIDAADASLISGHKWRLCDDPLVYVATLIRKEGKKTTTYLHRFLLNPPPGYQVDHINGNPLDNQRCNLRIVTQSQNLQNRHSPPRSNTGVRGVHLSNRRGKFVAYLYLNRRHLNLGEFLTLDEAVNARRMAEQKYFTHMTGASHA